MESRINSDQLEVKQHGSEKAVLELVEEYQQEVLQERFPVLVLSSKTCRRGFPPIRSNSL